MTASRTDTPTRPVAILETPPDSDEYRGVDRPQFRPDYPDSVVPPWLADPGAYGYFQSKVWDGWLAHEHVGDVLSCDNYVLPEYRLGNIRFFAHAGPETGRIAARLRTPCIVGN